jgi:hypothetical protein
MAQQQLLRCSIFDSGMFVAKEGIGIVRNPDHSLGALGCLTPLHDSCFA